ncbi:hypothetical protein EMIT0194MI4_20279 [Pseudomonas sp. IT-194MI4]
MGVFPRGHFHTKNLINIKSKSHENNLKLRHFIIIPLNVALIKTRCEAYQCKNPHGC